MTDTTTTETQAIPEGFSPSKFAMKVPFAEQFAPTYQKIHQDGVDIGAWVTKDVRNGGQMAHGGFLMTLGDIATGRAATAVMGDDRFTVHLSFNMNFYAAAPVGAWIEARGRVNKRGRSIVYCSCDYYVNNQLIGRADAVLKSSEIRPKTRPTSEG